MAPRSARKSAPRGVGHLLVVGVSSAMGDLWLPGFQVHVFGDRTGDTYDRLDPKKVLLHTTEGSTVVGAMRAYEKYPPISLSTSSAESPAKPVGLGICIEYPLSAAGQILRAAEHAATRRDAMDVLTKYIGLTCRTDYTICETADEVRLTVDHPERAKDQGAFTEFHAAITYRILRIPLGIEPDAFIQIEISCPRLGDFEHYVCFFEGVPIKFDPEETVLVLKPAALNGPSATPDPELFEYLETYLRTVSGRRQSEVDSPAMEELRLAVAKSAANGTYRIEGLAEQRAWG